ncbi:hypothetical protein V5H47_25510, partial [Salmonella enterica]|uniref:hypothetical protein n=1 Tax=Salmonella enterica TaxID=28901 RepID=UPI002FCDD949
VDGIQNPIKAHAPSGQKSLKPKVLSSRSSHLNPYYPARVDGIQNPIKAHAPSGQKSLKPKVLSSRSSHLNP